MKHDLAEFTTTMHEDGGKVASSVKDKLTVSSSHTHTHTVDICSSRHPFDILDFLKSCQQLASEAKSCLVSTLLGAFVASPVSQGTL